MPAAALALLAVALVARPASAQKASGCLYNDAHWHVQDFKAQGEPIPELLKMMDGNVCRAVMMGLAVTIARDGRSQGLVRRREVLDRTGP